MKLVFLLPFITGWLIACPAAAQSLPSPERVEPASWWTGMKDPSLQLLVKGDSVAGYRADIRYPGVSLMRVHKTGNPNYLLIDLRIAATTRPGSFPIRFSAAGKKTLIYNYRLLPRDTAKNRIQGISSKDLIYLLMPDRFANGDTSNDRIPGMRDQSVDRKTLVSRHGGDLLGILQHLDYLADLGVTAIWCTPEIANDQPFASYHGYAVTDHYAIDPRFGSNELYREYVRQCHARGLKVIKDIVHNHIGSEHWMMKDPPSADWVHRWPSYTNTSFKEQTLMDPYAASADKKQMTDGWFDRQMPDLNQQNPFVQQYLIQNNIWWIEWAGIDGLRLDTYPYNDLDFMAKWALRLRTEFPRLGIFGETLVGSVINQAFFTGGKKVNQAIDTHLPGITDAQWKEAVYDAVNDTTAWGRGTLKLYSLLANDFVYEDATKNVIFLDNHDMSRMYSLVEEDLERYKSCIALLLTGRGIPQLYYGTELLMKNFSNPDGLVREDLPGGWPGDSINMFTATGRMARQNEAFDFVKKLAVFRKNNPVLQTGRLMQYVPYNGIYVYFRYDAGKTVMVLFNSTRSGSRVETGRFSERLDGFSGGTDIITGKKYRLKDGLQVPAKTTLVLALEQ